MSIVCTSSNGWLISHAQYISQIYNNSETKINFKKTLFEINVPYKNLKKIDSTLQHRIEETYNKMYKEFKGHFNDTKIKNNNGALQLSDEIYEKTRVIENINGGNTGSNTIEKLQESSYIFPENCKFFSRNVEEIHQYLNGEKYDLILLDPPWWNKYIRRKRKKTHAYQMMYNNDLKQLKLEQLLTTEGLIVVWCTNSSQHYNTLVDDIFPSWGVKYTSTWYWLKITLNGEPVCNYSKPPGKQPYEQIIFACSEGRKIIPPDGKIVVSVPSALHSHKPPLDELLKPFLPKNAKCLEIFARYLLPNWTSYGNEVLKFQHESLYEIQKRI